MKKPDATGGNGNIYFDETNNTATKYLRNTSTSEKIKRFIRELDVLKEIARKNIPNIVEVLDVNIDESNIKNSYVKMRKYDGSLSQLCFLTKGQAKTTLQLILPIIKALKLLSENVPSIYHRDLKPDNILFLKKEDEYELFLADFGICYLKDETSRLTPENIAIGARMFIAPEYEVGRIENVNEKGDIFSLGKIIWYMINGEVDAVLPSNFWFIEDFDLTKKYPDDIAIINANLIISACLGIDSKERCSYDELIKMIETALDDTENPSTVERQYKVKLALEKKNIERIETLKKNKLLVNSFSTTYIETLKELNATYEGFTLLEKLYKEYEAKSRGGADYTSRNIIDDSAHYLYSTSYDGIYISINFNPAGKGEKYANITFDYNIRSNGKRAELKVGYNQRGIVECMYNNQVMTLSKNMIRAFLEEMITNYIS